MSAGPYYIDSDRGSYLRHRVHKAYIATFQEGATAEDRAVIRAAPQVLAALRTLHATCIAMDAEQEGTRPSEEEYAAAMQAAEAVLLETRFIV